MFCPVCALDFVKKEANFKINKIEFIYKMESIFQNGQNKRLELSLEGLSLT